MELIEVAECLIDKIKKDYDGDVSLVHIYGSYYYKDTHNLSDLDLFFVPKTERGKKLAQTFILNGIGFDYFAISWERLERISNHEESLTSIITEGETIYYHSVEDLEKFNVLKQNVENTTDKNKFRNIGRNKLKDAYKYYFDIVYSNNIIEVRDSIIGIIYVLSSALASLNCTSIKRIRKYFEKEISGMILKPKNFDILYNNLFKEQDVNIIKENLYALIKNTEKLFEDMEKGSFIKNFNGFYEEMIQHYNKIYHACDIGDIYTPLYASVELTNSINTLLKKSNSSYDLPDMIGTYDPNNLNIIKEKAKIHQNYFENILKKEGIKIRAFKNINELKDFLDEL